jgi:hypothetical protein
MTKPCFPKLSHQDSCVRHERQFMGFEAQVESAEGKLKPVPMEKVCQLICRVAEKLDMVRMFPSKGTDELLNLRVYRLNIVKAMSHPTMG